MASSRRPRHQTELVLLPLGGFWGELAEPCFRKADILQGPFCFPDQTPPALRRPFLSAVAATSGVLSGLPSMHCCSHMNDTKMEKHGKMLSTDANAV